MASFIDPHLPLLLAPFASKRPPKQRRTVSHVSERPEGRMWLAIESNDPEALTQALKDGAKVNNLQNSTPPLWACVEQGKLELAGILLKFGANPNVSARGGGLWKAISKRNNPQEAEKLKALLGNAELARPSDFIRDRSYRLVEWWIAQNLPHRMTKPDTGKSSYEHNQGWISAAVYVLPNGWDYLSKAWGIKPGDPRSLATKAGSSTARWFWEDIIRRDNVEMAQEALRRGWGPPEPSDYNTNYNITVDKASRELPTHWKYDLGWAILEAGAENLWAWWSQIPGTLERMQAHCTPDADREGTTLAVMGNAKKLEMLIDLGLFHPGPDAKGRLLAHEIFSKPEVPKTILQWWVKNRPEDWDTVDLEGKTPLELTGNGNKSNERVLQQVRQERLNQGLPEVDTQKSRRVRF